MDVKLVKRNKEILSKAALWHQGPWIPLLAEDGKPTTIMPSPKTGPVHSHASPGPQLFHLKQVVICEALPSPGVYSERMNVPGRRKLTL